MSLIPFILELADELHEFNRCLATGGMDVDDFGFGIYPHELQSQQQQPQQQQQQQSQHPLQQQQAQQQHLSQQRRPRTFSQFYWLPNISKSRHHPYYRGKPCCNKTPIHLVHDHQLEKETSSTAGGGGGGGGGVINSSPTTPGATVGDKESTVTSAHTTNSTSSSNTAGNSAAGKSAYSVVNKNGFQVSMNVKQFAPNELTVKTIDNCIVVEGQHEDKEDGHGVISRHFIRKYMLPKGYDPSEVLSTLSSDGILTVKAPPPTQKTDETMERIVDIQQTGGTVQVQQSAVKEPTNTASSGKEAQTSAASAGEQTVTVTAATVGAAGSLPAALATTLQKQQQAEQQQKPQKQQPQQLSATVEVVQQQQQPTKLSQPTTKDLQVTRERNGKLETNELLPEQEIETRTAEQTATSSNTNTNNIANNNNNNNINTNSNNNSGVTNIDCIELKAAATAKATLQTEVKEKERAVEDAEQTHTPSAIGNVNNKTPHASDATKSSSTMDAIMADATADEPMETEEELEAVTKEEVVAQKPVVVSIPTADIEDDTTAANNIEVVVNSATTTTTSNNNTTSNDIVTPSNDAVSAVEANGIEINTTNNIDIELAPATIAEASDIVLVTNNGVSNDKTASTGDGLTISLETTVAEIDGVTDMDTDVAEIADVVDGVADTDGMDGGVIAIGVDIGVGVDVNVITPDGNNTAQNVEDVNEDNLSAGNLVAATQSPTSADLVAAADAAILLAKTQCDGGAGDVVASKPALTTEEITN